MIFLLIYRLYNVHPITLSFLLLSRLFDQLCRDGRPTTSPNLLGLKPTIIKYIMHKQAESIMTQNMHV